MKYEIWEREIKWSDPNYTHDVPQQVIGYGEPFKKHEVKSLRMVSALIGLSIYEIKGSINGNWFMVSIHGGYSHYGTSRSYKIIRKQE